MASRPGPLTISPASLARRPGSLTRKKRTLAGKKFPLAGKIFLVARGRIRARPVARASSPASSGRVRLDALPQDGASHYLSPLHEPGWALNVFWLPDHREEGVRRALDESLKHGSLVRHPGPTRHAGTRWVTERITSPAGEATHPNQNRNDRHERHHGRRPTRTKTAFRNENPFTEQGVSAVPLTALLPRRLLLQRGVKAQNKPARFGWYRGNDHSRRCFSATLHL